MPTQPLLVDDLDYELPPELIATQPSEPRDSARLLVMYRSNNKIEHCCVRDLPKYVGRGDTMVFNRTSVLPARLLGKRADSGGRVEGLFINAVDESSWIVMLKSNGKLRPGQVIMLNDSEQNAKGPKLELVEKDSDSWLVRLLDTVDGISILNDLGLTPLPPYILKARSDNNVQVLDAQDRQWYETTFADPNERRSVAAPTAGLHFTPQLLKSLDKREVQRLDIVLDVGLGTFQPIRVHTIDQHEMHTERFTVPIETLIG